jgi:hypothetical protein
MSQSVAGQHLTTETWKAMLADPDTHRAMFEHVAAGCEVCDAVLAATTDRLDGEVDQALLSLQPQLQSQPLDELAWARFRKVRRTTAAAATLAPTGSGRTLAGVMLALAAALVAVVATRPPSNTAPWNGVKGSTLTTGPALSLQTALRQKDNTFLRLDDGTRVSPSSVMVFRATSSIEGPARVFLQRGATTPVEVGQTAVRAGTFDLQNDSGLLGVTLENESGEVSVWVVVGETPFTQEVAVTAITSGVFNELGVARVRLHVE